MSAMLSSACATLCVCPVQADLDRSLHEEELKEKQEELDLSRRSLRQKQVEVLVRAALCMHVRAYVHTYTHLYVHLCTDVH